LITIISSSISQLGGKYRLRKTLLSFTPKHDFFLSLFAGSCIYELNKPRAKYEAFNDADSELINYLLVIREYPKEFDDMKKGVFGLVSQEICNRIIRKELIPRNNIEKAFHFYYLNKMGKVLEELHYQQVVRIRVLKKLKLILEELFQK